MAISRQEPSRKKSPRSNQIARTRAALLQAATELVREGRAPSIPEAADRALVSVATAYRYFPSAEDLWWEALTAAVVFQAVTADALERLEAAGDNPQARLEAVIRSVGFHMIDDQVPFRRIAKIALEQWFRQADATENHRSPTRAGRRNEFISKVMAPLEDALSKRDRDRIAHALGLVIGTDAMIALTDGVGLDAPNAKEALLDASRWLLAGALAELANEDARSDLRA